MQKVLVTGASGFLGKHLCAALSKAGHSVTQLNSKNCDLLKQSSLFDFKHEKYDLIYHLAAWTQAGDFCLYHRGEQWINNQLINTNVLDWWHKAQSQAKMIAIGSSCCYPDNLPLKEENFLRDLPTESLLTYAFTKRMLYVGLDSLHHQFGHKYLLLVPSTLYGPDYHLEDGRQMHFIFDLIRKIYNARHGGEQVVLWGDGNQSRELIHVKDFVDAAIRLAETADNEIINIGSGKEFSIKQYAGMICEKTGYDAGKIIYDTGKYVGAKSKVLNVEKLKRILPDFQPTEIKTGLSEVIAWYEKAASTSVL